VLVPWTPLTPSRRERALRLSACVLALGSALALAIAAFRSDPFGHYLAVLSLGAAAAGLYASRRRVPAGIEVGIDSRGSATARQLDGSGERWRGDIRCVFASPWLITLRGGAMWIRIWPDSVPQPVFRRLWVHVHWNSVRTGTEPPASDGRRQ
jgi:hypothetical protein